VDGASHPVDSGALEPDTRLPSETELATQYGVARVSVRRAIELLRERGKVLTFHGRGTYVAEKPGELGVCATMALDAMTLGFPYG
jgi:GntR family transcriptional regulator